MQPLGFSVRGVGADEWKESHNLRNWPSHNQKRHHVLSTHLLVVPVTFLPVLRAEHTTTTRLFST